ncbi:hypothetical protein AGMMS50212_07980 [Spirochaetia bacterium]|nr:hypothetical protein AGMMS50212_07980 [Spirochaetia bacterium]
MPILVNLYRLQALNQFQINSNPANTVIFFIVAGAIAAVIIFLNVSKIINSAMLKGQSGANVIKERPKVDSAFFREAKKFGFNRQESAQLEKILRHGGDDTVAILYNIKESDACFKAAVLRMMRESRDGYESSELTKLFAIRNTLEYFLVMTGAVNRNKKPRSYMRKQTNLPSAMYLVNVTRESKGMKTVKKLVLSNKIFAGTILNISIGGCAINTQSKIKTGSLMKIEFSIKNNKCAMLGEVLRINVNSGFAVLHIKFLKVPKKALNVLNMFIFNYS